MASSPEKCPVDHSSIASSSKPESCPVDHSSFTSSSADKCPVDQNTRWSWTNIFGSSKQDTSNAHPPAQHPNGTQYPQAPSHLPVDREISSIPRTDGSKWVYPSQAQFYSAMERKNHNPHASDMQVVVPIHNAVNERAWAEVMKWEQGQGGDKCGGVKLVSFKGRPNERTPRARWKMLLGYTPPFDRHDWVVDRCGTRVRYVIDFYTGRGAGLAASNLAFYLDVRPALDNWEGARLRARMFWHRWTDDLFSSSASTTPPSKSNTS